MIENRVRKLMAEEQRLQKQITIANRHSHLADQVRSRREYDAAHKEDRARAEAERVERQRQVNNERREKVKKQIADS